jgi:hypothetical protein
MLGRTALTDLTDCELTLLDAFVWNDMCVGALLSENYEIHLNLPRSHDFARGEVVSAADRLERDRHHLVCIEDSRDELDRYFQLTKRGFEAWEVERDPPWPRYCEQRCTMVTGESDRSGPGKRSAAGKGAFARRYLVTVVTADRKQGLACLRAMVANEERRRHGRRDPLRTARSGVKCGLTGLGEVEVEEPLTEHTVLRYKVLRNLWRLGCHYVYRSDPDQYAPFRRGTTWGWEELADLYRIHDEGNVPGG